MTSRYKRLGAFAPVWLVLSACSGESESPYATAPDGGSVFAPVTVPVNTISPGVVQNPNGFGGSFGIINGVGGSTGRRGTTGQGGTRGLAGGGGTGGTFGFGGAAGSFGGTIDPTERGGSGGMGGTDGAGSGI